MQTVTSMPSNTSATLASPLYTEAEYGTKKIKITTAEKVFIAFD